MLALSPRTQIVVGLVLATLMGATRGHHFGALEHLPSASWAVFFLAGVYLRSLWAFPALLVEAAVLDFAAVTWGGVDSFCVSSAYGFLLPAYGALWLAGRWYTGRHQDRVATLSSLTVGLLAGTAACELISSGSFYFLSGRFEQTSVMQFASRFAEYFPQSLSSLLFYVGVAGVIHMVFSAASVFTASSERVGVSSSREG